MRKLPVVQDRCARSTDHVASIMDDAASGELMQESLADEPCAHLDAVAAIGLALLAKLRRRRIWWQRRLVGE
jgi:hypothetical protein